MAGRRRLRRPCRSGRRINRRYRGSRPLGGRSPPALGSSRRRTTDRHRRPGYPVSTMRSKGDWCAAAAEWTRLGCPYDAAIAQLGGDVDAVQAALGSLRRLGARAAARRAQQRLAQSRGRTPDLRRKDTTADPHGLTKRQRDVLELLAAGHSDAEIAAGNFLTECALSSTSGQGRQQRTQSEFEHRVVIGGGLQCVNQIPVRPVVVPEGGVLLLVLGPANRRELHHR